MMKKTPKGKGAKIDQTIEKFITGATAVSKQGGYPWEGVDDRIPHTFNLRLTESEYLKLKYIAENTPYSIHSFIMETLRPAIDQEIARLTQ